MYMILFEEQCILPSGDKLHFVSAICKVTDANAAECEWKRVGDVYSAYILSDVPNWNARIITHSDK